jgi:hypothetical protein
MVRVAIRLILALAIVAGATVATKAKRVTINVTNSTELKAALLVVNPGDTVTLQAGKYCSTTPHAVNRAGTSGNPITYTAVGVVKFACDLDDNSFTAAPGLANVYRIAWSGTSPGTITQGKFTAFDVDDSNNSFITLEDTDGPLRLNSVTSDTDLVNVDGTWRLNGGFLYIHAFGDRVPSEATTDFDYGASGGTTVTVNTTADWNVFDGFTIYYTFTMLGSDNVYENMDFQGANFALNGDRNTVQNLTSTHGWFRGAGFAYSWHEGATGGGITLIGDSHRLYNIQIYDNWNSGVSTADATNLIIDGIMAHSAPNHCTATGGGNSIVRNAKLYNCQDYIWENKTDNLTFEHWTVPSGVGVEALVGEGNLGPVIVRNSIFSGGMTFIRGPQADCTHELGSIVENSVINKNATVYHCANDTEYTVETYIAACAAATISPCITYRNNVLLDITDSNPQDPDWLATMVDGMWPHEQDSWDATLVTGSPAIDIGLATVSTTDIIGNDRDQGSAPDAGAYESGCTCPQLAARMRKSGGKNILVASGARLAKRMLMATLGPGKGRKHCAEERAH